jgi:hypothetical protein
MVMTPASEASGLVFQIFMPAPQFWAMFKIEGMA